MFVVERGTQPWTGGEDLLLEHRSVKVQPYVYATVRGTLVLYIWRTLYLLHACERYVERSALSRG